MAEQCANQTANDGTWWATEKSANPGSDHSSAHCIFGLLVTVSLGA